MPQMRGVGNICLYVLRLLAPDIFVALRSLRCTSSTLTEKCGTHNKAVGVYKPYLRPSFVTRAVYRFLLLASKYLR